VTDDADSGRQAEVRVSPQGRVTIPAQIRRAAGIATGTAVVMYVEDGRVVLETRAQLAERLRRDVAASWTGDPGASAAAELIAERRAEARADDSTGGRSAAVGGSA